MVIVLWVALGLVAGVVTARVVRHLAVAAPLRRVNYRGLSVPTAAGIAIVLGVAAAHALHALAALLANGSAALRAGAGQGREYVLVAAAFALLGLWDDIAGTSEERGWRAHVAAVRRGAATSGAIKLVGGGLIAFAFVAGVLDEGLGWSVIAALVIALSANAFNLLDVRPGRATKVFLVALVLLYLVPGPAAAGPLWAAAGAAIAFLPFDLRERAMLGDTGAMALGAMAGWGIVLMGHPAQLAALGMLVVVHLVADRPGLSRLIDRVPPLRALDRAGRVPE